MARFQDVYTPPEMPGWPCTSTPRTSTLIVEVDSGDEQVNRRWQHPLRRFTMPEAVRDMNIFEAVRDHFLVMGGPAHTWPFRDPLDFASRALAQPNVPPAVGFSDQVIGNGNGATTNFQLIKTYKSGAFSYARTITLPVIASVVVSIDDKPLAAHVPPLTFTVTRPGGVITFAGGAPHPGGVIKAGFLFDCEVRFESDDALEAIAQAIGLGGYADLTLVEVRHC
jgi:uncharacterized protein (TIGR02217 family)